MSGDLEGLGHGPPRFLRWGTAHASVPQYLAKLCGCAGKHEATKKGEMNEFFCEIEVFREEKSHKLYGICALLCSISRDTKKTDKRRSMTKKGHQKF